MVVLAVVDGALEVVVYRRSEHPARGLYALPGGFVRLDESLDAAAVRLLRDKAGLGGVFIEQLYTFGTVGRDPRGRIITVAYYALVDAERLRDAARDANASIARIAADGAEGVQLLDEDAAEANIARLRVPWAGEVGGAVELFDADGNRLALAFDHALIVGMAVKRIRGKLDYAPIGFQLLPPDFTLRQLQDVHEAIRGELVNKDSFRRRMLGGPTLEATGERQRGTAHRPAELYRFVARSAI